MLAAFDAFSSLVAAICAAAFGLVLWDIGSRSPTQIARDLHDGIRSPRALLSGIVRACAGALLAACAIALVVRALQYGPAELFSAFAIATFVAALAIDALIGDDVRRSIGIRR